MIRSVLGAKILKKNCFNAFLYDLVNSRVIPEHGNVAKFLV